MENYTGLAKIYDFMMSGVDYDAWADYILTAARSFGSEPKTVLDLACGTGSTTFPLAQRGLKATGLDLAPAMLKIARERAEAEYSDVEFVECNMLELDFPEPFDMIVSFQDGINYLTGENDFLKLAAAVSRSLKDGGLFMFDLNRVSHYSDSEPTIIELDDMYLVYENKYNPETAIWHINLTGFLREGDLYSKFSEEHEEKNHDFAEVQNALAYHGLKIKGVWRMFYETDATEKDNRVLVIAQKEA